MNRVRIIAIVLSAMGVLTATGSIVVDAFPSAMKKVEDAPSSGGSGSGKVPGVAQSIGNARAEDGVLTGPLILGRRFPGSLTLDATVTEEPRHLRSLFASGAYNPLAFSPSDDVFDFLPGGNKISFLPLGKTSGASANALGRVSLTFGAPYDRAASIVSPDTDGWIPGLPYVPVASHDTPDHLFGSDSQTSPTVPFDAPSSSSPNTVPAPSSFVLTAVGVILAGWLRRTRSVCEISYKIHAPTRP